jgi:hypothetical protein
LSGSDKYGRFSNADCSNVLIAERKTQCHKLKDDQLRELLTLVPETESHSDSLCYHDSSGGINDSEQPVTSITLQQRKKER